MTVIHSVSLGPVHRQVLCHGRVYNGQRQSWNLCACVAGLHCSFVRVKHEVLLWWCPRGSIPRNLDKNIEWNNISSFSCPVIADGISHYPSYCSVGWALVFFPWIYLWLPWCWGTEGSHNQVIFLSSSEHGVLVEIWVLCSSQVSPSRKPALPVDFFSFKQARNNTR